jgi:hypothetical protein
MFRWVEGRSLAWASSVNWSFVGIMGNYNGPQQGVNHPVAFVWN